jgi:hypothetical protein
MEKEAKLIYSTEERCYSTVPERFLEPLMKMAYKFLSRDKATFEELTPSEQQLWASFEMDQIYRLLTVEPDTVPELRFNWISVPGGDISAKFIPAKPTSTTLAPSIPTTTVVPDLQKPAPRQLCCLHHHQLQQPLACHTHHQLHPLREPLQSLQHPLTSSSSSSSDPSLTPPAQPLAPTVLTHTLRPLKHVSYRELHLGNAWLKTIPKMMQLHPEVHQQSSSENHQESKKGSQGYSFPGSFTKLLLVIYGGTP